jgi:hypothetical protein
MLGVKMVEVFKQLKRDLKASLAKTDELIDDINGKLGPEAHELVERVRHELGRAEKLLKDLEYQWQNLDSTEKAHYKAKLRKYRQDYDKRRVNFFSTEDQANAAF